MNSVSAVMNNIQLFTNRISQRLKPLQQVRYVKKRNNDAATVEEQNIPKNLLTKYYSAHTQKENGIPYDCKPFKMLLEKGKTYTWCLCGQSHTQPMCDATHRMYLWNIKLRPIRFAVAETKEYWLCLCKQTKNRPFCDGSHRDPSIQDACKFKVTAAG